MGVKHGVWRNADRVWFRTEGKDGQTVGVWVLRSGDCRTERRSTIRCPGIRESNRFPGPDGDRVVHGVLDEAAETLLGWAMSSTVTLSTRVPDLLRRRTRHLGTNHLQHLVKTRGPSTIQRVKVR